MDEDDKIRANVQTIRDRLNGTVVRAARQFNRPFVSWAFDGRAYRIVITEDTPTTVITRD